MDLLIIELIVRPFLEVSCGVEHGPVCSLHPDILLTTCDLLIGYQRFPDGPETRPLDVLYQPE